MKTYDVAGVNEEGVLITAVGIKARSINDAVDKSGLCLTCNDILVYRNDKLIAGPFFPSDWFLSND